MHAQELPFDILERVFLTCVTLDQAAAQPAPYCAPISLCHVSQWWRKVAMDSPRVWERLTLEVETFRVPFRGFQGKRYIYPKTVEFSDWWWANAKKRPLALSIREPEMPEEPEGNTPSKPKPLPKIKPSALISIGTFLLSPMVVSARSIHIAHGHLDNLRILCNPSAELSNLECLTVSELSNTWGSRITYSTLAKAPLLRYVHFDFYRNPFTFPFSQLTHVFISQQITCSVLRRLITEDCPNLIVGGFDIGNQVYWDPHARNTKDHYPVLKLRQLTLAGNLIQTHSIPLDRLFFPALTALRLAQFDVRSEVEDVAAHMDFLLLAMPNLTELHLPSSLLCKLLENGRLRLLFAPQRVAIGSHLRLLEVLVLAISFAVTEERIPTLIEILQSQWFQPGSGRVQIEVQDDSMSPSFSPEAESRFTKEVVLLNENRSHYDFNITRTRRTNWSWRTLPEDLTYWREAAGFYETLSD